MAAELPDLLHPGCGVMVELHELRSPRGVGELPIAAERLEHELLGIRLLLELLSPLAAVLLHPNCATLALAGVTGGSLPLQAS